MDLPRPNIILIYALWIVPLTNITVSVIDPAIFKSLLCFQRRSFMRRKTKLILVHILNDTMCVLGIVCVLFNLPMVYRIITAILCFIDVFAVIGVSQCPRCGKIGLSKKISTAEEHRCIYCGRKPWYLKKLRSVWLRSSLFLPYGWDARYTNTS